MTSPQLTSYSIMKAEGFFSKIRNKTRGLTLTILFNQNLFTGKMNKIHPKKKKQDFICLQMI